MNQSTTPQKSGTTLLIILKWILSIMFLMASLGSFIQGQIGAGFIMFTLFLLLLPPLSDLLKSKFKFWQSRGIRYVTYIVLFFVTGFFIDTNELESSSGLASETETKKESKEDEKLSLYADYISQTEENVANLSDERKAKREEFLTTFKANPIYEELVLNKVVESKYLPVLNAISWSVPYIQENKYGIEDEISEKLIKSENGQDKYDFVAYSVGLALPINGGFPPEIIDVFERYKKKYNLYSEKSVLLDFKGKEESVDAYDLTPFFLLIDPENKEFLTKFYEAKQKGLSHWITKGEHTYPYLATKEGFISHLKEVYPESKLIPKVDIEITAVDLYEAYDSNEVSADEAYKGKKLLITGVIDNIGKDIMDDPYVSLKVDYFQSVNCYFSKKDNKILSQLSKGQKVKIIGKCRGFSLSSVMIDNCEVWE